MAACSCWKASACRWTRAIRAHFPNSALSALRSLAQGKPATFTATPPIQDRYDRLRVQGFGAVWFQQALLAQGLARVAISSDRGECAAELYAAEAHARMRHAGIWALDAYRIRAPMEMNGTTGSFQLVDGLLTHVGRADGRVFLDFGGAGPRGFAAVIAAEDRRAFRKFDLAGLTARHIRVRGIVQDYRGRPEIFLSNPAQIEVLD